MVRRLVVTLVAVFSFLSTGCGVGAASGDSDLATGSNDLGQGQGTPSNAPTAPDCPALYGQCRQGVAGACAHWESDCRDGQGACPDLLRSCQAQHDVALCSQWEAQCRDGAPAAGPGTAAPDAGTTAPAVSCATLYQECRSGDHARCELYEQQCR